MPARDNDPAPKLLSGGNPQIPKGDGLEPVEAYIAAMPGWKRDVGRRVHDIILSVMPDARLAVKWNQPFYGKADGWLMSFRCYTDYVQVQFLKGTSLDPVPPKESKHDEMRYADIRENDELDESLFRSWVQQCSTLPGASL